MITPKKKIINFFSFILIFIYSKVTYNYYSIGKKNYNIIMKIVMPTKVRKFRFYYFNFFYIFSHIHILLSSKLFTEIVPADLSWVGSGGGVLMVTV